MPDKARPDHPGLARVIERQVRNWEIARAQRPAAAPLPGEEVAQFVTIANIVGAGGNEVASLLGEELKWPVFDRDILTTMVGDDETRAQLYRSMDERTLGWFEDTFRSLVDQEFRKNDYFHRLRATILYLARQGPAIFIGRSADLILPGDKGLRVKIIASPERCAANFARRCNTTIEHARSEVKRIESERRGFIQHHFHIDAYEPTRFDLLINVERFTTRQAVDLILSVLRMRQIVD